jgi:multidrug efflux pump subunit AcrB
MNRAIAWFATNHVASNLIMLVIVCAGLATLPTLTQELIPNIELEALNVTTLYPGASPSEVEASITNRVEEAISGLQGVKHVRSVSAEGASSVTVQLMAGEDIRKRVEEVRSEIDSLDTLPDDAEEPTIKQIEINRRVLTVSVAGETDEWTLKRLAQQLRDEIAALPGITEVDLSVAREYEISIEVSEMAMDF